MPTPLPPPLTRLEHHVKRARHRAASLGRPDRPQGRPDHVRGRAGRPGHRGVRLADTHQCRRKPHRLAGELQRVVEVGDPIGLPSEQVGRRGFAPLILHAIRGQRLDPQRASPPQRRCGVLDPVVPSFGEHDRPRGCRRSAPDRRPEGHRANFPRSASATAG